MSSFVNRQNVNIIYAHQDSTGFSQTNLLVHYRDKCVNDLAAVCTCVILHYLHAISRPNADILCLGTKLWRRVEV